MINTAVKEKCSGCTACVYACPKGCISMKRDGEGFLYPFVDTEKCISCSLCERVCERAGSLYKESDGMPDAYAAMGKDEEERLSSSSGGAFSQIARAIIKRGGAVFGAAFTDGLTVKHVCIENEEDIAPLRSSKYVQSEMGDTFSSVKKLLECGRYVLFCGTPCQVGGLLSFLGKEYPRLYCADIICHGVPSPLALEKYAEYRKEMIADKCANKPEISRISFRDKREGWESFSMTVGFTDGTEYSSRYDKDIYMKAFLSNKSLRPSCFECRFKTLKRPSDITLADFWGVDSVCPDMNDKKGTSLLLVHTEKGRELLFEISPFMNINKTDTNEAVKHNRAAVHSPKRPASRDRFMRLLSVYPFDVAHKRTETPIVIKKIKGAVRRLRRLIPGRKK